MERGVSQNNSSQTKWHQRGPRLSPRRGNSEAEDIWRPRKAVSRWLALGTSVRKKQGLSHRTGQQGSKNPWERLRFSRSHGPTFKFWPWRWPILWLGINYFIFTVSVSLPVLRGKVLVYCVAHAIYIYICWHFEDWIFPVTKGTLAGGVWNEVTVVNPVSRMPWIPCLPE